MSGTVIPSTLGSAASNQPKVDLRRRRSSAHQENSNPSNKTTQIAAAVIKTTPISLNSPHTDLQQLPDQYPNFSDKLDALIKQMYGIVQELFSKVSIKTSNEPADLSDNQQELSKTIKDFKRIITEIKTKSTELENIISKYNVHTPSSLEDRAFLIKICGEKALYNNLLLKGEVKFCEIEHYVTKRSLEFARDVNKDLVAQHKQTKKELTELQRDVREILPCVRALLYGSALSSVLLFAWAVQSFYWGYKNN